jgi:hypothetical protein
LESQAAFQVNHLQSKISNFMCPQAQKFLTETKRGRRIARSSALLGAYREKRGSLLLNMRTPATRALWILLVVLAQGQDYFERFMTIQANIIVNGHRETSRDDAGKKIVTLHGASPTKNSPRAISP